MISTQGAVIRGTLDPVLTTLLGSHDLKPVFLLFKYLLSPYCVGVIRGARLMRGDVRELPEDDSKLSLRLSEPSAIPGIVELASRLQCFSIRAYGLRIEHSAFVTSFARGAGSPYFTT